MLPFIISLDLNLLLFNFLKGTRAQVIHETLKYSSLWSEIKTFHLTENMRLKTGGEECAEFEQYLLRIGEGKEPVDSSQGDFMVKIPDYLKSKSNNVKEFCQSIFPDVNNIVQEGLKRIGLQDRGSFDWLMSRAIICPTNKDTEEINQIMMKGMDLIVEDYQVRKTSIIVKTIVKIKLKSLLYAKCN